MTSWCRLAPGSWQASLAGISVRRRRTRLREDEAGRRSTAQGGGCHSWSALSVFQDSIAKGAILLRDNVVPAEWRKSLSTRRAAVAQSARMRKAGYARRQGPSSTEFWRFIFTQAVRTELQPACLRVRCSGSLGQGSQQQPQARKGIRVECHTRKLFGGERFMVEQQATTGFQQMPVKLCRLNRPGWTGEQNSRRIAPYGTDT